MDDRENRKKERPEKEEVLERRDQGQQEQSRMLGQSLPGGHSGHSRGVSSQVCQMGSGQPGASR